MRRVLIASTLGLLLSLTTAAPNALAQPDEGFDKDGKDTQEGNKQEDDEKKAGDKMPGEKEKAAPEEAGEDKYDPTEDPNKAYRFIGLRFRNVIIPKFMLNLFADGGTTVNVFTFGPEFTTRKDHLEFNVALSYADYSMDSFLFKGKSDGNEAYERVSSSMKLFYLTLDILYEIPLDKKKSRFAFLIGGGVGLAPVFGSLYRTQVHPNDPGNVDPDDPRQWRNCTAAGNPQVTQGLPTGKQYCDDDNEHFGDPDRRTGYDEPSWANGGSKPFIFPWISLPQISFRYKPIKQLQTRLDLGFSITGFFFGMNAAYGL